MLDGGHAEQDEQTVTSDGREVVRLVTRFGLRDEDGVIDAVCIMATDVTERRVEERTKRERLQCSETIYRHLRSAGSFCTATDRASELVGADCDRAPDQDAQGAAAKERSPPQRSFRLPSALT